MTKLKQGDEFTDKKGNEYRYKGNGMMFFNLFGFDYTLAMVEQNYIKLIDEGELIPVKPKTVADEMLEWIEEKKANGLIRVPIDDVCDKLSELLAKHEEKQ